MGHGFDRLNQVGLDRSNMLSFQLLFLKDGFEFLWVKLYFHRLSGLSLKPLSYLGNVKSTSI